MTENPASFTSDGSKDDAGQQSSPGGDGTSGSPRSVVRDAAKKWPSSAAEFDAMFDDGEDIDHLVDWTSATRMKATKRVNVDFPGWMVVDLDREAKKRGVTRQALIKMWLADRLEGKG